MNVTEIMERGQSLGITGLEGMSKGDMIRAIQIAEGSRDCFGNLWRRDCQEYECYWREDCLIPKPEQYDKSQ